MSHSDGAMIGTGGFIDTPNQRLGIRHILPIVDPRSLGEVAIAERNGRPVHLKDVAQMVEGHQPLAATRSSTGVRDCCSSSRSFVGEHPAGDPWSR